LHCKKKKKDNAEIEKMCEKRGEREKRKDMIL
jgi:hypothetical protein